MKAFAYLRVSTNRQELSPEVQREQITHYCAMKGYELVHVFDETGVSGSVDFSDRPKGAELLARLGEVDAVIFAKLDRAFRDTVNCILTVELLKESGKAVHFLDIGIDTTTPAGQLCLEMMASFAKFERARISERIRESLDTAKRQGKKIGPAGLGWQNAARMVDGRKVNGGIHVLVHYEQTIIARIRALRERKMSYGQIARLFVEEQVPTRRGGRWASETVRKIDMRASAKVAP